MRVPRRTPQKKAPPPIPDEMLGDCTIEQLSRMGGKFHLILEPLTREKVQHDVTLVHDEDLPWKKPIAPNQHVLTFDEFVEVMKAAAMRRIAGSMMTIEEAFRMTDFARKHPELDLRLEKVYEAA